MLGGRRIAAALAVSAMAVAAYRKMTAAKKQRLEAVPAERTGEGKGKDRVAVDAAFFRQLSKILKIVIPGPLCAEVAYLLIVGAAMAARTYLDVWMLRNGTTIERAIITANGGLFKRHVLKFAAMMIPIAIVNNILKLGLSELHIRFRERLTKYVYGQYLSGLTFYRINALDGRIANVDHLLTADIDRLANSLTDLYSNVAKPLLDITLYAARLSSSVGAQAPLSMLAYLAVSGLILTRLRRPLGRFTVVEQRMEGEFRHLNNRLVTHSEEVAFYRGNATERGVLLRSFGRLITHLRRSIRFRFASGVADNIVAKYIATIVGYYVVSRPFFDAAGPYTTAASTVRMEAYYRSGRMLLNLASAVGRLVLAGRDLTRLAAFTSRVNQLYLFPQPPPPVLPIAA